MERDDSKGPHEGTVEEDDVREREDSQGPHEGSVEEDDVRERDDSKGPHEGSVEEDEARERADSKGPHGGSVEEDEVREREDSKGPHEGTVEEDEVRERADSKGPHEGLVEEDEVREREVSKGPRKDRSIESSVGEEDGPTVNTGVSTPMQGESVTRMHAMGRTRDHSGDRSMVDDGNGGSNGVGDAVAPGASPGVDRTSRGSEDVGGIGDGVSRRCADEGVGDGEEADEPVHKKRRMEGPDETMGSADCEWLALQPKTVLTLDPPISKYRRTHRSSLSEWRASNGYQQKFTG